MVKSLLTIIFFIGCLSISFGQEYKFIATVSESVIQEGNTFTLEYETENLDKNNIRTPKFDFFDIVSGPNTSFSMQTINGVTRKKQSISYVLVPKKVGRFVIPAATAYYKGKKIKSNLVKITVDEASKATSNEEKVFKSGKVFVKAELSHDTAFLGQQVFIDYNIYFAVQVENYNMMNESEYKGFFARALRMGRGKSSKVDVEGEVYYKQTLKRVALFPQQTGKLNIDESRFRIGISTGDPNERRSIWSRPKIDYKFVNSSEVSLDVLDLPAGAPKSFSGAVGEFKASAIVNPTRLTTDDAITINMSISGDGDIKYIRAPELSLDQNLEVYDKKVLQDNVLQKNNAFRSTLGFEFQVLPKKVGRYLIKPEFTYFNPDSLKYITVQTGVYNVMVSKGTQTKSSNPLVAESEAISSNIKPNVTSSSFQSQGFKLRRSSVFWILSFLPIIGLLGAVAYKRILVKRGDVDLVLLRQNEASNVAKLKLEKAYDLLKAGESRDFFDEISKALIGYSNDKLQISNAELSKDKVAEELKTRGVSDVLIQKLTAVFSKSEMALFAGQANQQSMQSTYDEASSVIVAIENELNEQSQSN